MILAHVVAEKSIRIVVGKINIKKISLRCSNEIFLCQNLLQFVLFSIIVHFTFMYNIGRSNMIVYIEDVLIENFLVTYLIISMSYLIISQKPKLARHILASLLGACIALVYPLLSLNTPLLTLLKICFGFVISLVAYSGKTKKQLLFYLIFMFTTAIYGGINLMISFCIYGDFSTQQKLPTILIVFVLLIVTYLIKQCERVIYKRKKISNFIYDVVIKNNDQVVKTKAYLDTGNVLVDPVDNRPVTLVGYKVFQKLCSEFAATNFLTKSTTGLKNGHYINVKTATGNDSLLVFDIDSLEIKNSEKSLQIENPIFALSKVKLSGLDCDVILNANLFCGGNNV